MHHFRLPPAPPPRVHRRLLIGCTLALALVLAYPPTGAPRAQTSSRVLVDARQPVLLHREAPDDLPGVPARPVPGAQRERPFRVGPFTSVQVNVDAAGANVPGDAANEPTIVVDPNNHDVMAIGWRQFDTVASNFRQAGWAYTSDGGRTWTAGTLAPGRFHSDPVMAADADGNFYYASLGINRLDVFKSSDGGATWAAPVYAYGGDKPWMTIDRTGGTGAGNVYCSWQPELGCCGTNIFTRSVNGARSFSYPRPIPSTPIFGTMTVAPDGTLFLCGGAYPTVRLLLVARSADARDPSKAPTFVTTGVDLNGWLRYGTGPNPVGLLGQPWIAMDPTGTDLYLLCSVGPAYGDPLDVRFTHSTDGGKTWATPVRVNDDPPLSHGWQWFGTMSVAPNGRIDVVWNDTPSIGTTSPTELRYTFSTDGGATWEPSRALSPVWDSYVGWPHQDKIGDYYHMISDNLGADLAYAATLNGEQDVYYLRIKADTTPPDVAVAVSPDSLWPPNHKMVDIRATVTVHDDQDPKPTWTLWSITSGELEAGRSEGAGTKAFPPAAAFVGGVSAPAKTPGAAGPDIAGADFGTPDTSFQLRAERSGDGGGRVYTVTVRATDASGNEAFAQATVRVPHDQAGKATASSGPSAAGAGAEANGGLGGRPEVTALGTIRPNPFNPSTQITFTLATGTPVELRVYDVRGTLVRTLRKGPMPAGTHTVAWNGRDADGRGVSTGVYFVRFAAGGVRATRKIVLLK